MKTNDYFLIGATAAYSYLFYEQNAGINFLIFNLLFIGIFLYRDKNLVKNKKWLLAGFMCLMTSVGILIHSSVLAILANICGILLLSAFSFDRTSSVIFSFLFSCYSVLTSFIFVIVDGSSRSQKNEEKGERDQKTYKYFAIFIVILLSILFFILYRQSNPLFADNTRWINLNFISFSWIIFTLFGFFMVYGLLYHRVPGIVANWENTLPVDNRGSDINRKTQFQAEISAGILLFTLLNLMLLILNMGDINTIWFKGVLPKGVRHSDFVHKGVTLIILSILIAAGLIMFLYRSNFNTIKNSKILKILVYAWIFQNLVMLFSTACRNQFYIHDYNLTYKRVGVYVWLFLAVIGLSITFIKVHKDKSNWFLVRSNFTVWFCMLALSSLFNWDLWITRYNLNNKAITDIDFYYLFSLSDSNIPELLQVSREKDFHLINGKLKNYTNSSSYGYYPKSYKALLMNKIKCYLKDYKTDWQSWDLRDKRIMENLTK